MDVGLVNAALLATHRHWDRSRCYWGRYSDTSRAHSGGAFASPWSRSFIKSYPWPTERWKGP